ncbi:MAG TPA: ferritin-like fold-containing protein, partial [Terrimesophilobacter sp.]|nr:ferritin-like fold-containing protein [Terrimesophilobacter sp.]
MGLAQLAPDIDRYLAHGAYLQLALFELLSTSIVGSPSMAAKTSLSHVANTLIDRHHALATELESRGHDPAAAMEPFADMVDTFRQRIHSDSWAEVLMSVYVVSGILDDCFVQLAGGLSGDYPDRMAGLLGGDAVT